MNKQLSPSELRGKPLEEIIMNPTWWAQCIETAVKDGMRALFELQIQLSKIEGPIARARECHVFLALDKPKEAAKVIEGETHNLCKAMYLSVRMHNGTLEDYLYVASQPEKLI